MSFKYEEDLKTDVAQNSPTAAVHFPNVIFISEEEAVQITAEISENVLLAMALMRGAHAKRFATLVYDYERSFGNLYLENEGYVGNLLTGLMGGEHAGRLSWIVEALKDSEKKRYLVGLYQMLLGDGASEFSFVRMWQICEIIIDSYEFDPSEILLDFDGRPVKEDGKEVRLDLPTSKIYKLLVQQRWRIQDDVWAKLNIIHAFRNSVVHFGSISDYKKLRSFRLVKWAEKGHELITLEQGRVNLIWSMKNKIELLIWQEMERV